MGRLYFLERGCLPSAFETNSGWNRNCSFLELLTLPVTQSVDVTILLRTCFEPH